MTGHSLAAGRRHARHRQALSRRARQRPYRLLGARRRNPCAAGRERRRQEHADERAVRPVSARRGRNLALPALSAARGTAAQQDSRAASTSTRRATPSTWASAWCTSTSCWCPAADRRRERHPGSQRTALHPAHGRGGSGDPRLSQQYHLQVDPTAYIWQLSVGEQQRVEIIKLLYRGADVLILDEPTAVLTPQEVGRAGRTRCVAWPTRARRSSSSPTSWTR